jgi:hypothetical protein
MLRASRVQGRVPSARVPRFKSPEADISSKKIGMQAFRITDFQQVFEAFTGPVSASQMQTLRFLPSPARR